MPRTKLTRSKGGADPQRWSSAKPRVLSLATFVAIMTQQYIVGELSVLIAGLYPVFGEQLAADVRELRRRVESAPVGALRTLAVQATAVADRTCWSSLEEGDAGAFARQAMAAALLHDFVVNANLLA